MKGIFRSGTHSGPGPKRYLFDQSNFHFLPVVQHPEHPLGGARWPLVDHRLPVVLLPDHSSQDLTDNANGNLTFKSCEANAFK